MNAFAAVQALRLGERDNVAVAMTTLPAGLLVEGVVTARVVPPGHKFAVRPIAAGEAVVKGGIPIGMARGDIAPGDVVHGVNARDLASPVEGLGAAAPLARSGARATFEGYVREDGRVATRNTVGVFVVGNCGATAARKAATWFDAERLAEFPNVDAVVPYVHELGCGMEMTGEPMDLLRRTLSGTIRNPNTAAAVVVALGCERNNLKGFLEQERLAVGDRLRTVTIQEVGGIRNAIDAAIGAVREMLPEANRVARRTVGAEHLVLGLKSGAPDGFSGLSANPALGVAVDLLVEAGGTAILSETPEILGVAPGLMARAASPGVAEALRERLDWWRDYSAGTDTQFGGRLDRSDEAVGLLNIVEKSVDGVRKAGSAPLSAVYRYAEPVAERGLVFMDTPGYDPVSVTGQIAGGATMIAYTTGLGSVFGSQPAPTVKIASNSDTFVRMMDDTDVDCGPVLTGNVSVEDMGRHLFDRLLRHASGERTKAEVDSLGENEFVPWPIGRLA